jgi:hypothetical protein
MSVHSWYDAILKSFFTQQILRNYALTINGVTKIQPQSLKTNQIIIMNNSSNPIYLGADSNVNASNGFPIFPNDIIIFKSSSEFSFYLYGNNQEIRVLEAC